MTMQVYIPLMLAGVLALAVGNRLAWKNDRRGHTWIIAGCLVIMVISLISALT